jgi:hypothetical protein
MNLNIPEIFREHWLFLLLSWLAFNVISAMPSPAPTGASSSWGYKWAFAIAQTIKGSVPRIVATLFPAAANYLPGLQQASVTAQNQQNIDTTGKPDKPTGSA